jgi:hypothetical protein
MLAQCPKFAGTGGEFAEAGTARHNALSEFMRDDSRLLLDELEEEQRDAVIWAAEYIRMVAPMADHPIDFERTLSFTAPDFTEQPGTPDVVCHNHIFDLKWRWRDYTAQMAAYALMLIDKGHAEVKCHLLFGENQTKQILTFDRTSALAVIEPIYAQVSDTGSQPKPCDYCGWCSRSATCPALTKQANAIAAGREDWELEQYHASKIDDPAEMAKALRLARAVIKWAEAIEHHAKEMAVKQGLTLPGFETKTRRGNRYIPSVIEAFPLSGLPQPEFLAACSVSFTDLVERYAAFHSTPKAASERELERKLGSALTRKNSSISLVEKKEK